MGYSQSSLLILDFFPTNQNREGETRNDESVLQGLQPHSNLKKLKIIGFNGKRFPLWTRKMEVENVDQSSLVPFNNLIEISLINFFECEEIPMFGQLPNLSSLRLEGLRNVKSINCSFYGLEKGETRIVFPALKILVLTSMDELTEWAEVESAVFPHLQHLEIYMCPKLKGLPNGMCTLSLKSLIIMKCPKLKGLPNGICTLNLKELMIMECPNLEDIGEQQSQGSLERLVIRECNALLYLPCEIIGLSLRILVLKNISSLKNLPGIIECLPKSPHLTILSIIGVPQFMTSCFVEILPFFSSLEVLRLDVNVSMGGSMESVDTLLQACRSSSHSLTELELKGFIKGCWVNLVESLQNFTALSSLMLETIGKEKFPQWLHCMNESRYGVDNSIDIKINGERIWLPLTELRTLLNSGNPGAYFTSIVYFTPIRIVIIKK